MQFQFCFFQFKLFVFFLDLAALLEFTSFNCLMNFMCLFHKEECCYHGGSFQCEFSNRQSKVQTEMVFIFVFHNKKFKRFLLSLYSCNE